MSKALLGPVLNSTGARAHLPHVHAGAVHARARWFVHVRALAAAAAEKEISFLSDLGVFCR